MKNKLEKLRFKNSTLLILLSFFTLFANNAHSGAVATATSWATETAAEILHNGGNAVDATVAASFVLNVTQPFNMGIGGGGFLLVSNNDKVNFFDSRETAPASANPKMFLLPSGQPIPYFPERVTGPNPVGIPGTLKGLYEVHTLYGKLPWATLLQPAIRLAREGHPINHQFDEAISDSWSRISSFLPTALAYGDGHGSFIRFGQILKLPHLAATLETIAKKGANDFYEGELARSWVSDAQAMGVKITMGDLKNYTVSKPKPVDFNLLGLHGFTSTLPSASGLMVAGTMRFLEYYYKKHLLPDPKSANRVIVTTEAMKYFQTLRDKTIADVSYAILDPQTYLGSKDEKDAWNEINQRIKIRLQKIPFQVSNHQVKSMPMKKMLAVVAPRSHDHTTQLSIADDHGMAVSYTTTIEQWFGSGLMVPTDGFLLNNELSDFDAEPGHPNSPAIGKRPRSNMSPLLFYESNKPSALLVGVVGCAGGPYIPTSIVVFLENYYLYKMTAHEAVAFPRFHPDSDGETIEMETFPDSTFNDLKTAEYKLDLSGGAWSALQALMRRNGQTSWEAVAEPRGDSLGLSW